MRGPLIYCILNLISVNKKLFEEISDYIASCSGTIWGLKGVYIVYHPPSCTNYISLFEVVKPTNSITKGPLG